MPSPVTPDQFGDAIPANNADFCTRFSKLLNVPQLLRDLFSWMFTDSGELSTEFLAEASAYSTPTGAYLFSATLNVGTQWLLCDGREVSRTTYADLFTAIGTRYGAGNGTTTFNLPDAGGRSPMGAGLGDGLTNRDINDVNVGEEEHTMTVAELVPHTHSWDGPASRTEENGEDSANVWRSTLAAETGETGGGNPFNVIHPCLIMFVFIKT